MMSIRFVHSRIVFATILLTLRSSCIALTSEDFRLSRAWDTNLPNLVLENVSVSGESIQQAWEDASSKYLLRSVLYVSNPASQMHFSFQRQKCTANELFNALTATYTNYTWSVDSNTGVIWFHPVEVAYNSILPLRVPITNDLLGVPMRSGVLEPLSERFPQTIDVSRGGTLYMNTFDYSVSLPRGSLSVRDILNYCCSANPTKTFYVQGQWSIRPINLVSKTLTSAPPGAIFWWKTQMGDLRNRQPDNPNLINALADSNPHVRRSACAYLEALSWQLHGDSLISHAEPFTKAAWAALGLMSVRVRISDATSTAGLSILGKGYSENLFSQGDPQLAVLAAFELASVANVKSSAPGHDTRGLDIVMRRQFPKGTLDEVQPELSRRAYDSEFVRKEIIEANPKWDDFSADDVKAIADLHKK